MEKLLEFLQSLTTKFQEWTPIQKAVALGLTALALGSLLVMALWIQEPDYQLLYANLAEEDAAAVVDQLKTRNIPYQLGNQGRSIRVPSNLVHETRIALAGEGLPAGREVGLELFEDTALGMTEFVQKLNFQRALQGELARTISSLEAVEFARIHLVIPKEEVFFRERMRGKASVTLKIRAGKSLSETQVQGIVHLVSSSVERIQAKDVVVVDLKGNILSGAGGDSEGALMTTSNHKFKRGMEKDLEKSIVNMLEDALGPGKIIARVSADINFDKVEKTEEIFDPDSQVVRSEQSMAEQVVGSAPPGGLAGAESLLPTGAGQAGGAGSPAKRNNEKNTFNYEINKVVRRVSQTVGDIKKLSVAVLVDGVMTGDPPAYQARSAEEMNQLLDIVKSAVGFNQSRGDQIQLENIQFDRSLEASRAKVMEEEEMMNWAMLGAKVLLGVIIVLIIFLRILRPLVNWVTTSVEVLPEEIQAPSAEEVEAAEEEKRLAKMTQQNMEVRKAVADFVDTDAKYAAGVLRKWMRDRG